MRHASLPHCAAVGLALLTVATATPRTLLESPLERGETVTRAQDPSKSRLGDGRATSASTLGELKPDRFGDAAAVRAAIERGLAFLAARQAEEQDGSFPPTNAVKNAPVAITALASLAYMASGSSLDRGPHGRDLSRAVDFLLSQVDRAPTSQQRGYIASGRDEISRTHGHGFATLALAQAFAVSPSTPRGERLAEALQLAVACIERSQGLEGAWYYDPVRGLEHEGSVTIAMVQALRAAKGAGVRVDATVIAKAVDYVERSQKEDGSFRYALGSEETSVALTAAALSTLHATGKYHGKEILQGYDYIERELRARALPSERDILSVGGLPFPFYERLYLAQAYWQNPDAAVFDAWAGPERRELLKAQQADGSWGGSPYGDCYATAVNVLVLALSDELLPIFQR